MSLETNHKNENGLPRTRDNVASLATAIAANRLNFASNAAEEVKFAKPPDAHAKQKAADESIEPDEAIEPTADNETHGGRGRRIKWLIVGGVSIFLLGALILFARGCQGSVKKKLPISPNQPSAPTQPAFNPEQAANTLTENAPEYKSGEAKITPAPSSAVSRKQTIFFSRQRRRTFRSLAQ